MSQSENLSSSFLSSSLQSSLSLPYRLPKLCCLIIVITMILAADHDHVPRDEDLQEIEGQIEADKKLQEKLILEDFGPSTAGRVRFHHNHDVDGDSDGDGDGDGDVLNSLDGFSYSDQKKPVVDNRIS